MIIDFDTIKANPNGIVRPADHTIFLCYLSTFNLFLIQNERGYIVPQSEWELIKEELDKFYDQLGYFVDFQNERTSELLNSEDDTEDKSGFVYLCNQPDRPGYKIGYSKDPIRRMSELKTSLIHSFHADDMSRAETKLHRHFAGIRISGEWFDLTQLDIERIKAVERFKNEKFYYTLRTEDYAYQYS